MDDPFVLLVANPKYQQVELLQKHENEPLFASASVVPGYQHVYQTAGTWYLVQGTSTGGLLMDKKGFQVCLSNVYNRAFISGWNRIMGTIDTPPK